MDLELSAPIAPDGAMPGDIRATKMMLNRLGYYLPDPQIGMNEFADANLFDAIRNFQSDQDMPATGRLSPGDRAVEAMNALNEIVMKKGKYIWRTMGDDLVRPSHADRDNEEFFWRKPPPDGHPGEPFACRCWAVPIKGSEDEVGKDIIDPPIEPVYPELLLMPFLARGKIMNAVKVLAQKRNVQSRQIQFERPNLQHAYKHAREFGIKGTENNKTLKEFEEALVKHIKNVATEEKQGTFRNKPAVHYFNRKTHLNVAKDTDGKFWFAWKLSKQQMWHMLKDGKIGGGK